MNIKNLIQVVVGLVIGIVLLPVLVSVITGLNQSEYASSTWTLIQLIPTIYVLLLFVGAAAYLYATNK
jgi:hypothetical protein